MAFVISPTALLLLLVVLIYGWVAPLPVAPSEQFGRLEEVNGSYRYHEKSVHDLEQEEDLGVWNLSLSQLYSPQVSAGK